MHFKQHTVLELLTTIILIFLIPTFLIFFYFFNSTMKANEALVNNNINNILKKATSDVNEQLSILNNYPRQISLNRTLINLLNGKNSTYTDILICQELQKIFNSNTFAESIFIYSKNQGKVYSTANMYTLGNFNSNPSFAYYKNWKHNDMIKILNNINEFSFYYNDQFNAYGTNSSEVVSFLYPIQKANTNSKIVLIAIVNVKKLQNVIGSAFTSDGYSGYLKYKEDVIAKYGDNDLIETINSSKGGIGEKSENSPTINVLGEKYIYSDMSVSSTDLKISMLVPAKVENAQISKIIKDTVVLTIISIILIAFAYFMLFRYIYSPVKKLSLSVNNGSQKKNKQNEFEIIKQKLLELNEINNRQQNLFYSKSGEYDLLICLLNGEISNNQDFQEIGGNNKLFSTENNVILISKIIDDIDRSSIQEIQRFIEQENSQDSGNNIYKYIFMMGSRVVTILTVDNQFKIAQIANELSQTFQFIFKRKVVTGVGSIKKDINSIKESYSEAVIALDVAVLKEALIIWYDDIDDYESFKLPVKLMAKFEFNIVCENEEEIGKCVEEFINIINNELISPQALKSIYLYAFEKLISVYSKYVDENEIKEISNIAYSKATNLSDMSKFLQLVSNNVRIKIKNNRDYQNEIDKEELRRYIYSNITKPDFSLSSTAEKYNMSISNFSITFKHCFGIGFKDYVDKMKMDIAKEMLNNTNYSLQIISEKLNYANASNFSRAFKLAEGMTPGDYRKISKK